MDLLYNMRAFPSTTPLLDADAPRYLYNSIVSKVSQSDTAMLEREFPRTPYRDCAFVIGDIARKREHAAMRFGLKYAPFDVNGAQNEVFKANVDDKTGKLKNYELFPLDSARGETQPEYASRVAGLLHDFALLARRQTLPRCRLPYVVRSAFPSFDAAEQAPATLTPVGAALAAYERKLASPTCESFSEVDFFNPGELLVFLLDVMPFVLNYHMKVRSRYAPPSGRAAFHAATVAQLQAQVAITAALRGASSVATDVKLWFVEGNLSQLPHSAEAVARMNALATLIEGESLEHRKVSKVYRVFSQAFLGDGAQTSNPLINTMRALLADAAVPDEALSALHGTSSAAAPAGVDPDEPTTVEACVQVCKQIVGNAVFLRAQRSNSSNSSSSSSSHAAASLAERLRLQRMSKMFDVVYVPAANPVLKRVFEDKTTNATRRQEFNSQAVPLLLTSIDFIAVARLLDAQHIEFLLGKRHDGVSRGRDDSIIVNTLANNVVAPNSEPALSHLQRVSGLNTRVHVGLYGRRNGGAMRLKALALPLVVPGAGASTPEQVTPGGTFATAFQEAQMLLTDVLSDDDGVRRDLMREVEDKLKRVQLERFAYNAKLLADVSPTDFLASSLQTNDVANSITFAGVVQAFHNNLLGSDEDASPEFVRDFNAFVRVASAAPMQGSQQVGAIALHRLNAMMEAKADVFREVRPQGALHGANAPLRGLLSRAVFGTAPEAARNGRAVHIMFVPVHGAGARRGCDAAALGMVQGSRFVTVIIDGNRPRVSVFDPAGECTRETLVVTFAMLLILGVRFRASRSLASPSASYAGADFHVPAGPTRLAYERAAEGIVDDYRRAGMLAFNTKAVFPQVSGSVRGGVDLTQHLQIPVAALEEPRAGVELHVDYQTVVVDQAVLFPHAALWYAMYHLSSYGRADSPDDFLEHVQARPVLGSGATAEEFVASNMANFVLRLGEACFKPPLDYTPRVRKKIGADADRQDNQPLAFWGNLASPAV
jgi:hypothetical protein